MGDWFETDSDCYQHCRKTGERKYKFIQMVWLDTTPGCDDDLYAIVTDEIDLSKFSVSDLEMAIAGFYDSLQAMEKAIGLPIGELDQLIAECQFENHSCYDSCSLGGTYTKDEARKVIDEFMKKE